LFIAKSIAPPTPNIKTKEGAGTNAPPQYPSPMMRINEMRELQIVMLLAFFVLQRTEMFCLGRINAFISTKNKKEIRKYCRKICNAKVVLSGTISAGRVERN
jgi:hypothetical protein